MTTTEPARLTQPLTGWNRWRFLLTPTWIGWFAFACLVAVVCSMLGQWQLSRRDAVLSVNQKVNANYDREPVPFAEAAGSFSTLTPSDEWLPVAVRGEYLSDKQLIVRNRPNNGQNGYLVLVPFKAESGQTIVVNRGWVPLSSAPGGRPENVPAPPTGTVDITVRLRPSEPALDRSAPEGQVASIELETVEKATGLDLATGAYGQLRSESPPPAQSLTPPDHPSIDEGPHLSYAMQWYTFGILAFIGLAYSARRHAVDVDDEREWQAQLAAQGRGEADATPQLVHPTIRAAENAQRRAQLKAMKRAGRSDEEEEDALLDR